MTWVRLIAMDAAGSERAAVMGISEGGPLAALFAATYPERTLALVLYGSAPRFTRAPGYPWGPTREEYLAEIDDYSRRWGTRELAADQLRSSGTESSDELAEYFAKRMRQSASPGAVAQLDLMNLEIDVRDVVSTIRVPTLVLHRTGDPSVPVEGGRWMADHIPGARFVEFPGSAHGIPLGDAEPIEREIESFFVVLAAGAPADAAELERVLATVLFTDIVGSTAKAAELGDSRWRELIEEHHAMIRRELVRYRGRELDTAGDGFFAAFDGPARAIRCGLRRQRRGARPRPRHPGGTPHRRMRARRREDRGHRRAHRRTRRRRGPRGRGARLPDRARSRRRLGAGLRGAGRDGVEGRPGRVAALRRHTLTSALFAEVGMIRPAALR
jgi:esterase/lipase